MPLKNYLQALRNAKQSTVSRYLRRIRMWEYRQNTVIHRAQTPTHLDKARLLGYKKKDGILIFRTRVKRGGRVRKANNGKTNGKPAKSGIYHRKHSKSLIGLGEIRVGAKYPQYRVLGSYWVGEDRIYKYSEVIVVDPLKECIRNDKTLSWICKPVMKRREARGLTTVTKRSRGIGKGIGFSKTIGGSRTAAYKRNNKLSLRRYR